MSSTTPPQTISRPPYTESEAENEEEWEYEYSTTEFETYYVTLDLTTPNVPPKRRARNPPDRRAGRWTNPGLGKQKRHIIPLPQTFNAFKSGAQENEADGAQDPEIEGEGQDQDENENVDEAADNTSPIPVVRPTNIQILDLHTQNPIVSYDGHVYSCEWAGNIGTEMIFKAHDPNDDGIPVIRTLPGDVDLVAMSSARITSKSVSLKPTFDVERPQLRLRGNVQESKIPVGAGASARRKEQAVFLEQLMGVKEKKGEDDLVTVLTKTRPRFRAWLQALREKRANERNRLMMMIKRGSTEDEQEAKERIAEIDAEEQKLLMEMEHRGLHPSGKRKAKGDDRRKRVNMNDGSEVPKTRRIAGEGVPRKVELSRELGDLGTGGEAGGEGSGMELAEFEDSQSSEMGDSGESDEDMYSE